MTKKGVYEGKSKMIGESNFQDKRFKKQYESFDQYPDYFLNKIVQIPD